MDIEVVCMVTVRVSYIHRTEEEFNKGHVDGAMNVPYMFITSEGKLNLITPFLHLSISFSAKYAVTLVDVQFLTWLCRSTFLGKKKNPDFLSKLASICKKEDRLVVVIPLGTLLLYLFDEYCKLEQKME